jgi:hypothetical protein
LRKKCFVKRIFLCKFPGWKKKKKITQKGKLSIAKNCHNCLQYERVLQIFLLSSFEYHQIWLNILVNYPHLSNITKLKKKTPGERGNQLFKGHPENLPKSHPQSLPLCYSGTPKSKAKFGNILPL